MPSVGLNIVFGAPSAPRTKKVLVRGFVNAPTGGYAASEWAASTYCLELANSGNFALCLFQCPRAFSSEESFFVDDQIGPFAASNHSEYQQQLRGACRHLDIGERYRQLGENICGNGEVVGRLCLHQ